MKTLRIVQVLDTSGSMASCINNVLNVVNGLSDVYKNYKDVKTRISRFTFDTRVVKRLEDQIVTEITPLTTCPCSGQTNIFGGVEAAIQSLQKFGKKNDVYQIDVYTDGDNNVESHLVAQRVNEMKRLLTLPNWTITFSVPPKTRESFATRYGIPIGNVQEWEAGKIKEFKEKTTVATRNFMGQVSKGATRSETYYDVQPDLSKISVKKLDDVTAKFRVLKVVKESVIREFVEEKTKKGYVTGAAFYQLMKPEKVLKNRDILLFDINTKKLYGGDQARELIGLVNDTVCRVAPGNHSHYVIYVQSTSVNRKLSRGTQVMLDKGRTKNAEPTWDHKSAGV